uniref:Uncharacterized protein n=1 Tax=Mycena chlorophos TaxID=658473 RepID=A0ABQ0L5Y9_MYCCL|nr:predicted protein [Mycena chlorophos]
MTKHNAIQNYDAICSDQARAQAASRAPARRSQPSTRRSQGATSSAKRASDQPSSRHRLPASANPMRPNVDAAEGPRTPSQTKMLGSWGANWTNIHRFVDVQFRMALTLADVFVADVDLAEFRAQSHTTKTAYEAAALQMELLKSLPPIILSTIIVDRQGYTILVYLRQHEMNEKVKPLKFHGTEEEKEALMRKEFLKRAKPLSALFEGRTEEKQGKSYARDGVPLDLLDDNVLQTQNVMAACHPSYKATDSRHADYQTPSFDYPGLRPLHGGADTMSGLQAKQEGGAEHDLENDDRVIKLFAAAYPNMPQEDRTRARTLMQVNEPSGPIYEGAEYPVGVKHWAQCWAQQGTGKTDIIGPSSDLAGPSGQAAMALRKYFKENRPMATVVGLALKTFYPVWYREFNARFPAGQFLPEAIGPYLALALVWKLQVALHADRNDAGVTTSTPNGYWTGGHLYVPHFKAKFLYQRGDLFLSYSDSVLHALDDWTPTLPPWHMAERRVTPGRFSHVFFFPQQAYDVLEGKAKGWLLSSEGGLRT